jgi:hypothetical protein
MTENPSSQIRIDEIWSIEAVNHGDAALLNGVHIPKLRQSHSCPILFFS